jgi:prophage regulatory protein
MSINIDRTGFKSNEVYHHQRVLRLPEVLARVGLGRSYIYKLISQGDFPRPIKLGPRASGWLEFEIDCWLEQRIAVSRPLNLEGE